MSLPFLNREEYIEQAYFFRTYRERLEESPSQEILATVQEEILATTKLPMAIDFMRSEILHTGRISDAMVRLRHYFRPFQIFIMSQAEEYASKFDQTIALSILEREAEYLTKSPRTAGLFVYQFECIARNRLGYHAGMQAMAEDPFYDKNWREWILQARHRLGTTDFADMIYFRSQYAVDQRRRAGEEDFQPSGPILFDVNEGRIARANRGKDPLYMFAALQRQLDYPAVPRPKPKPSGPVIHPVLENRLQRLEMRLKLLESEVKGEFDLSQFYEKPPDFKQKDES